MKRSLARLAAIATLLGFALVTQAEARGHGACGSHGGPGYRKANGKCASWRD